MKVLEQELTEVNEGEVLLEDGEEGDDGGPARGVPH